MLGVTHSWGKNERKLKRHKAIDLYFRVKKWKEVEWMRI